MTTPAQEHQQHIGETKAIANHDHDLVHELSKRLDAVWRYDQCIANAENKPEAKKFWEELKQQDQKTVARLRELIAKEVENHCF